MRTLGIDLAAQDKNTAACEIDWETQEVTIHHPVTFGEMLNLLGTADQSAIDAPFGWPEEFRAAIDSWSNSGRWEHGDSRIPLRFRQTDLHVALQGVPLSVSSDRIAITAMRCAQILAAHYENAPFDRVHGSIIETYPAAALRAWQISTKGYKKDPAPRAAILARLAERLGFGLPRAGIATDHALDAIVCSLVARAYDKGETVEPPPLSDTIRREGWIHVPTANLETLR